jgi:outer membrane usher protein
MVKVLGVLLVGAQGAPAAAADQSEILSLTLNGRPTGLVGEFRRCDAELCASAAELMALGFVVPASVGPPATAITLSTLPGVRVRFDSAEQVIYVDAENAALRVTEIGGEPLFQAVPLSPSGYGAVLNYDMVANASRFGTSVAGAIDVRAFGPLGVFESTAIVTVVAPEGQSAGIRRLGSAFTYSDADRLFRMRLGDVVTGALAWNRAVRLGGIQISSDFNLRPDLVTYPLPIIRSSTAVPATVTLLANGVQQSTASVQPGPFAVQMLPVVTGSGEVSVAVQDALGRQTIITLPFYASSALLRTGLTSYSIETGLVRENYGSTTDHYSALAANVSARRGLTDWLTGEAHGEVTEGLALAGIGSTIRVGTLGIANFALSGSVRSPGATADRRWGGMAGIGLQRVTRHFNVSMNATFGTSGYRDISAVRGLWLPRSALGVSMGYQSGRLGAIGVSYVARNPFRVARSTVAAGNIAPFGDARFRIINGSYSVGIGSAGSLRCNAYRDFANRSSYGFGCGFSAFLGHRRTIATLGGADNGGQSSRFASISRTALQPGDVGYRIQDFGGSTARRSAEAEYYARWGRLTGGIAQSSGSVIGRIGLRGSLALMDGAVFASDHIYDSFAVVRTGNIGGVPVQYENRPIGVTDSKGMLLLPSLLSFQRNRISIDSSRLAPDIVVGETFAFVRPRNGSGVSVDFSVKRVHAAIVRLHGSDDKPLPVGSIVEVAGMAVQVVGYDGEAYLQDLQSENTLKIIKPNGASCIADLRYKPVVGDIPAIGPITCY